MKSNVQITMENIKIFLEKKSGHNYFAEMFGKRRGFISQIMTNDRVFWAMYKVEETIDEVVIEIYPEINCGSEYRAQTSEYLMQKNAEKRIGNVRMDDCGSIHLHIEHGIKDEAASIDVIEMMEHIGMQILYETIEKTECLAHGKYYSNKGEEKEKLMKALPSLPDIEKMMKSISEKDDEEPCDADAEKNYASISEGIDELLSALSGEKNTNEDTGESVTEDGIA